MLEKMGKENKEYDNQNESNKTFYLIMNDIANMNEYGYLQFNVSLLYVRWMFGTFLNIFET